MASSWSWFVRHGTTVRTWFRHSCGGETNRHTIEVARFFGLP